MLQGRAATAAQRPILLLRNVFHQPVSSRFAPRRQPVLQKSNYWRQSMTANLPSFSAQSTLPSALRRSLPRRIRSVRYNSTKPSSPVSQEQSTGGSLSWSQRFKEVSRKYGWTAVGVYVGLSIADFPFCFVAVKMIGLERVAEVEHAVAHTFWSVVGSINPNWLPEKKVAADGAGAGDDVVKSHENASIWTQLLLAYGVHKTLTPLRIPLAAAVTPKVVKTLRSWGWNIGPRKVVTTSVK